MKQPRDNMEKILISVITLFLIISPSRGSAEYSFEVYFGSQYNIPTPLTIEVENKSIIKIDQAEYDPDAFTGFNSPYYSWRFGKWEKDNGLELELVHEKLILVNKPDNVQHFEISHGYNLITINRAWNKKWYIFRLGGGIVLAHAESEIFNESMGNRGIEKEWPLGFSIAGPTAQVSIGSKRFYLFHKLFAVLETKFTASHAIVEVYDGVAKVPNAAFHCLFGIGYEF